ncbi:MAG: methylenetetrahydrofolate reductase [Oscillospiraceae bacterium]|nr:methylenetetrahydrofolate reductase [Oscillospiraceae bacterium]
MKITDILNNNITVSCELFPPKAGVPLEGAKNVIREIADLKPSFMSVTYGAGGSTRGNTVEIANEIQNVNGVAALAHLTCIGSDATEIGAVLDELKSKNITNVLALRGDVPAEGCATGDYAYANELTEAILRHGDFCVGGACYPEGHPESPSLQADIDSLKRKVDAGCAFLTTQMFFDNHVLYNFMFRLLKSGVDVPVIAGIMPVINAKQIARICSISGTVLPPRFRAIVDRFADNPAAMNQAGIAYATEQIIDLIANGVNHIHIYTMNKPDIAGRIMRNLSEILK